MEATALSHDGIAQEGLGVAGEAPQVRWGRVEPQSYAADLALLDSAERERAARFRAELHRQRWVFARAWLRRSLGELLGEQPQGIDFSTEEWGKPFLPGYPLHFNLAHSGEYVVLAWSGRGAVGVDVEEAKEDFAWEDVAAQAFSPQERRYLAGLQEDKRRAGFYEVWTRKEAYVKALGCGLGIETRAFSVRPELHLETGWQVVDVQAPGGYAAALAWKEEGR